MHNITVVAKRELSAYFSTPLAYVFIVIFLLLSGVLTFYVGRFFDRGQADLMAFFQFHPWLYLLLVPAVSMRLWAEENKSGTLELLLTLPISKTEAVVGKYLAAWGFAGIALLLTLPIWISVNILGEPDNGAILAGYLGSFLMAGSYLAIGSCISALTSNQVIAFVVALGISFLYTVSGLTMVLDFFQAFASDAIVDLVAALSFMTHFDLFSKGVIELKSLLFFLSTMGVWLYATIQVIELRRA